MSRTYVIADLHGRYDLLAKALARIEGGQTNGGTVVFLGDYIDRGPQSRQIVERLIAGPPTGWNWVTLMGNHEYLMVQCHGTPDPDWWLGNGGIHTLESYDGRVPDDHIEWAKHLPMVHRDAFRVFVHAGVDPSRALDTQGAAVLLWTRYLTKADITYPGLHIVHGHTPNRHGPELYPGRTNLDTGAVFFGRLVVGVFDDETPGGPVALIEVTASDPPSTP
ncbi:MAG: metallophosphoesterase family protein [Devosia sp.]